MTDRTGYVSARLQPHDMTAYHTDLDCFHLPSSGTVREATDEELDELEQCQDCAGLADRSGGGAHFKSLLAASKRGEKA